MPKRIHKETLFYPFLLLNDGEHGSISALSQFGGTQGKDYAETARMARQSLEDLAATGEPLEPPISNQDLIDECADLIGEDAVPQILLVEHEVSTAAERLNLTFPSEIAARLRGQPNASKYLTDLVRQDMAA